MPKNLPQLYIGEKGINALSDTKYASEEYGNRKEEHVGKSLDEFCKGLQNSDNQDKYLYRQIILD